MVRIFDIGDEVEVLAWPSVFHFKYIVQCYTFDFWFHMLLMVFVFFRSLILKNIESLMHICCQIPTHAGQYAVCDFNSGASSPHCWEQTAHWVLLFFAAVLKVCRSSSKHLSRDELFTQRTNLLVTFQHSGQSLTGAPTIKPHVASAEFHSNQGKIDAVVVVNTWFNSTDRVGKMCACVLVVNSPLTQSLQ